MISLLFVRLRASNIYVTIFYRSLILLISSLKNGVRTSQAQFFFYATALFCGAFTLRSMVQRIDKAEYDQDESNRLLYFYAIQYGLYVIMFFLNCFADAEPKVIIITVGFFYIGQPLSK